MDLSRKTARSTTARNWLALKNPTKASDRGNGSAPYKRPAILLAFYYFGLLPKNETRRCSNSDRSA
jgi:hypothetical protein